MAFVKTRSSLLDQICAHQFDNPRLCLICDKVLKGEVKVAITNSEGILRVYGRVFIPKVGDLVRLILDEAYYTRYYVHLVMGKMYHESKITIWLFGMRRDIVEFVAKCLTSQ